MDSASVLEHRWDRGGFSGSTGAQMRQRWIQREYWSSDGTELDSVRVPEPR
jgi:hypothetical protein